MMRSLMAAVTVTGFVTALSAAGPGPAQTPGASRSPMSIPGPDGLARVRDDSGVITASVPGDWAVRTSPTIADTGQERFLVPTIEAGPVLEPSPCDGCSAYFPAPTVSIKIYPYEPVGVDVDADCESPEVVPYDDGRFVGRREIGGGCDAVLDRVFASMPDAITVDILFVSWSADQDPSFLDQRDELTHLFDTILSTVEWTGLPYDEAIGQLPPLTSFAISVAPESGPPEPAAPLPPVDTVEEGQPFFEIWPYASFRDVPRLGDEPVRGSGCGGRSELGDVIPDGLWAGYLYPGADGTVEFDVACVYYGDSAAQIVAAGTATIVDNDPDFLVVNNSTRHRIVADNVRRVLWGVADEQGACTPQAVWGIEQFGPDLATPADGALGWLRVDGGAAQWVFFGCDTGFQLGG